ncbi:Arc family DNA-binding protein [Micromonospora sp. NBC_01638]|nr:Arc family DNA-binding protein [Micromonospora sp. NBC_01638]
MDDGVKEKIRIRAARHGRSMEAEVRAILTSAVADESPQTDLFSALTERFTQLGGIDLNLPARATRPRAADLPE